MIRESATDFLLQFEEWLSGRGEIAWKHHIPSTSPEFVDLPHDLSPTLQAALEKQGISQLYSHQSQSYRVARQNRDFVVVTPTASGKTLCYNLPVVQTLLEDPEARALYLFPTKALSQDQQAELNEIALGGSLPVKIQTYDGDTPASLRTVARTSARIVISNPDMLHSGILPNHTKWVSFFSKLRYVVVDEMHSYRGVFGSHVGNVLRRLQRIAAFYGAHPVFIFCSATIANPQELASSLIEKPVELIDHNGAGLGDKTLFFFNPALVDPVQGIRRSSATESEQIALYLLKYGVKTILFARSRLQVELIASYMTENLANPYNENNGIKVSPYRSGLLPSERRAIEKGLREGSIQGVVSTNALELGVDIGGLDAAVIAGYPGSSASFWQQAGRAGRRGGASLAVFVASSAPLDQYFATHPEFFLSQGAEAGHVDLDNPYIFSDHIKCAAFEIPFADKECFGSSSEEDTEEALALLESEGVLRHTAARWYWSSDGYPSEAISLRSATSDNVVIVDTTRGAYSVIGEMDRVSAKELLFEKAVYIHLGRQYMVKQLDIEKRLCLVERSDVEYWTDSITKTDLEVLTEDVSEALFPDDAFAGSVFKRVVGDVLVRTQAEKYKKLRFYTNENVGYGDISLPPEEMQTRALALVFEDGSRAGKLLSAEDPASCAAILVGVGRLFTSLAPVFLLCDPKDLGISERVRDPHFGWPTLYLYDKYPGGTGLAEALSEKLMPLLNASLERIESCPCADGCPSCIGVDLVSTFVPMSVPSGQQGPPGQRQDFDNHAINFKQKVAAFLRGGLE
ncbi:MAG TPA: DEAD/DEAH box helicase [Spirochaetales bacterium]|nr:DEAD/DEAH box helicase [Spirochaetales bacterium]